MDLKKETKWDKTASQWNGQLPVKSRAKRELQFFMKNSEDVFQDSFYSKSLSWQVVPPFNFLPQSFFISFPPVPICTVSHKRAFFFIPCCTFLSLARETWRSIVPSLSHFRWRSTAWTASWQYLPTLEQRASLLASRSAHGTMKGSSSPPHWRGNRGSSCTCGSFYSSREDERSSPSTATLTPPHISTQVRQKTQSNYSHYLGDTFGNTWSHEQHYKINCPYGIINVLKQVYRLFIKLYYMGDNFT